MTRSVPRIVHAMTASGWRLVSNSIVANKRSARPGMTMRLADVDDGIRPGVTSSESAELREPKKRNWVLDRRTRSLRRAAAYFAREISPKWQNYPLVRDPAADGVPVAVICGALGFSKQAFYAWQRHPVAQRNWDGAHLINAAIV
jgi:hypothetical protein